MHLFVAMCLIFNSKKKNTKKVINIIITNTTIGNH